MIRVLLVRHAQAEGCAGLLAGRALDPPLSAEGKAQAAGVARVIGCRAARAVFASPRRRARETAAAIAAAAGCGTHAVLADLDEVDFGAWGGQSLAQLDQDAGFRRWNQARGTAATPGGETMAGLAARMRSAIAAAVPRAACGPVVLVSHAEPIRALLLELKGLAAAQWARVEVPLASVHALDAAAHGLTLAPASDLAR